MTWIKSTASSVFLLLLILVMGFSNLFYHVTAVKIFESHENQRFVSTFEGLHSYSRCTWISSVSLVEKVITLNCTATGNEEIILHVNEKYQILSTLTLNEVHLTEASDAFRALELTQNFSISTTYYKDKNVYWISSENGEWLLDINDYAILWKVDKNYD